MGETILKSAGVKGHGLIINERGAAMSEAISTLLLQQASIEGVAFNVNTGSITLAAGDNGMLYLKNLGEKDLQISTIGFLFESGAAAGTYKFNTYQITPDSTPTGTLISGALAPLINKNKKAGSPNVMNATVYKGATSATLTSTHPYWYYTPRSAPGDYSISTGDILIPKGFGLAVSINSPGAANIAVFLAVHEYPLPTT